MTTLPHTEGPWRWQYNAQHKTVHLVGGRPRFDLTVMNFSRWGMGNAVPRFRDTSIDGMNLMDRLCDKPEWLAPEPGREHHKDWHLLVTHPDARLIQAAPVMLAALRRAALALAWAVEQRPELQDDYNAVSAAIDAANGMT